MMELKVIDWDGTNLPAQLKELPPGRYAVESLESVLPLTAEEDEGLRAALDEMEAGEGVDVDDFIRELRADATGQ